MVEVGSKGWGWQGDQAAALLRASGAATGQVGAAGRDWAGWSNAAGGLAGQAAGCDGEEGDIVLGMGQVGWSGHRGLSGDGWVVVSADVGDESRQPWAQPGVGSLGKVGGGVGVEGPRLG